ncbi:MAG: hypothetical protein ACOYM3_16995 [Terrimicrobiaceae bacterium]
MSLGNLADVSANYSTFSMKEQLRELIYSRSEEAFIEGEMQRDAIQSPEQLVARQKKIRDEFLRAIGGLPIVETKLHAQLAGVIEEEDLRIEKIVFTSRPGTFVTANLYLPGKLAGRTGAVLFLCGHAEEAKHDKEYQIVCRHLAKAGLIVLAQDPIGQGERFSYFEKSLGRLTVDWGTTEHDHAGAQCLPLGDGIARYFLHDAMRSVDYLCGRPEVDPAKIGVTGNSGGGTQTSMLMMVDPRLAAAAPGTFIMNRRIYQWAGGAQDAEQIWTGFTAAGLDHEDILLAMSPKPVCVLAATEDFFPIEGTRVTVERCRRIWDLCGSNSHLEIIEDVSTHAFTPALARAAARFFSRHLLGEAREIDSAKIWPIEARHLWCTNSGQIRGEIAGARGVHEENQDRLAALQPNANAIAGSEADEQKKNRAIAWLSSQVEKGRRPSQLNPRFIPTLPIDELTVDLGFWWSQARLLNEGLLFRNASRKSEKLPVTIAVWKQGTKNLQTHIKWIGKTCEQGRAVLVLNVSGTGNSEPNPIGGRGVHDVFGTMHKLSDDLLWLGDSLCALRIFDVLRALEVVDVWPQLDASDVSVYAHGPQGLYAELAASLNPRLAKIEVVDGLNDFAFWVEARHYDTPGIRSLILPGILQYADLADFRRWRQL